MTKESKAAAALGAVCDWLMEVGETQQASQLRERWEWYRLHQPTLPFDDDSDGPGSGQTGDEE